MRLKTNLVIGVLFAALAAYVYLHEIKGEEERRAEAERSSKLLEFSDHEVQRITIQREDGDDTTIERRLDEWWIVQPVETPADEAAIERYLGNIGETTTERVIEDSSALAGSESGETERRYGLAEPRLSLYMELSEGYLDTIRFGADSPTERFAYAQKRGANRQVITVRAWRFDNLDKGLFDLRDKRLLAFDKEAVREIIVTQDKLDIGRVIQLVKAPDGGWQIKSPVQTNADKSEVEGILNKLLNATAESFEHEAPTEADLVDVGLAPRPWVEVALTVGEDRAVKTLRIGDQSETDGHSFARDVSRDAVFLIDSTVVSTVSKSLFTLRDKSLLSLDDEDRIQRLELHRAPEGQIFVAERDSGGSWVVVAPERRPAKSWKINGILTDMREAQVKELVADPGEGLDLALFGLDAPQARLRLERDDGTVLELLVGAQVEDGVYATIAGSDGGVSKIDAEVSKTLEVTLDEIAQPSVPEPVTADSAGSDVDPTGSQ